jgi:hypothetical protein
MVTFFQRLWHRLSGEAARQQRAQQREIQLRMMEACRRNKPEPWFAAIDARYTDFFSNDFFYSSALLH